MVVLVAALVLALAASAPAVAASGDLDAAFRGDGTREMNFVSQDGYDCCEWAHAVLIQPDDRVILAGQYPSGPSAPPGEATSIVMRLRADGSFDPTFGVDGRSIVDFGQGSTRDFSPVFDAALQPNGKIVTVGELHQDFLVARYTANGQLDPAFNHDGIIRTNFGGQDGASRLAIQPDGDIVVAGFTHPLGTNGNRIAVARYTPHGYRDPTFDGDGKQIVNVGTWFYRGQAVAIQGDGRIMIGSDRGDRYSLVRLMPGGSLDTSFGTSGVVTSTAISGGGWVRSADMALQGNDIVVAGSVQGGDWSCAVARFTGDGQLDPAFGTGGVSTAHAFSTEFCDAVVIQPDGKIVVGGSGSNTAVYQFVLARFDQAGSLDPSFGSGGIVTTPFRMGTAEIDDLAELHGRIVAGGIDYSQETGDYAYAVARYLE
jgi:uncharacterized delta-60 repeat protein